MTHSFESSPRLIAHFLFLCNHKIRISCVLVLQMIRSSQNWCGKLSAR